MKPKSTRYLRRHRKAFLSLKRIDDLALLLEMPAYKLKLLAENPRYNLFSLPKQDGSRRWIEDPQQPLKKILRILNAYLQSTYFFMSSEAAYGFLISAKKDPQPRNILTNAQKHLGCQWLYNADVEDFFHRISFERVFQIFAHPPFEFDDELVTLLTKMTTFKERLPMGSPTSPILSNFSCIELDAQLLAYSQWAEWTYTRFADDLSFSSQQEIKQKDIQQIGKIVDEHGFIFNPEKVTLYGPKDEKIVTGLRLEEKVNLPTGFSAELKREITKLGHVLEAHQREGSKSKWVKEYQEKVEGMLNFADFILGHNHPVVLEAEAQMEKALNPEDKYSAVSWMNFGYF